VCDAGDDLVLEADKQAWDEFVRMLDEPPTPIPEMIELLSRPTVFDQQQSEAEETD